jgi:hypothetical protein
MLGMCRRRPPLLMLLLISALPAEGRADSLSSLPDPLYAHRDPGQPEPIAARVRAIVYPTMGMPALVEYGGELDVFVRVESPLVSPKDWKVRIWSRANPSSGAFETEILMANHDGPLGLTKLHVRVPARAPRETYDLVVDGPLGHDAQPNAVRIYGVVPPEYRIAVLADHQLWDPTWRMSNPDRSARDWPRWGERDDNRGMARQELAELAFRDPEFAIHAGDLLFGLDYATEYEEAWRLWHDGHVATFMIPGNHDAYATYDVEIVGAPLQVAAGLVNCHSLIKRPFDWPRAFAALQCVYGDVKGSLFSNLRRDGLSYWRRIFGPPYYAWDYGDLHFVALNTFDGTAARRHSYALRVDAMDLHLGAPAADNFGGTLGEEQLRWLADDLARASRASKTVVVIGHHDPRGNLSLPEGQRYQANLPFPTNPTGLGPFQEWNYDGEGWSSERPGSPGRERQTQHSGTRLLKLLAEHASYYIDGHAHRDEHRRYAAGDELAPGIRARRPIEFLRVTTAASTPGSSGDYWGYRVLEVRGRKLSIEAYHPSHNLGAVPGGNLWVEERSPTQQWVVSGLPRPTAGALRFRLPEHPKGWRFVDVQARTEVPLLDLVPAWGKGTLATWMVGARIESPPDATFPVAAGTQAKRLYEAQPAKNNHPPIPALAIHRPSDEPTSSATTVLVGDTVDLDARGTRDPDGDSILMTFITTPDGRETRAAEVPWTFATAGRFKVAVEAVDSHGARARKDHQILVAPRPTSP